MLQAWTIKKNYHRMWKKESLEIQGIHTEIQSYEVNSARKVIILPGNPGIGDFYFEFADQLLQKLNRKASCYIVSYAGFTRKKPTRLYSLQEELDHKIELIRYLQGRWRTKDKFVLVGHSIGAWLALRLFLAFTAKSIEQVFFVFPFFMLSSMKEQKFYENYLLRKPVAKVLMGLYSILRHLPFGMIEKLLGRFYSKASLYSKKVIHDYYFKESHIPASQIYLARTEFNDLASPLDYSLLQKNKCYFQVLYTENDIWFPRQQLLQLQSRVPKLSIGMLRDVAHDFCINTKESGLVAEAIVRRILQANGKKFQKKKE